MSAHGHPLPTLKVDDLVASMDDRSRGLYALSVGLCLLGVVGFIAGVLSDPQRAWTALVWNWSLWSGIAVGGAAVVAAASASYGHWLRPMRRIAEGLTAFLPISFLIMLVMLFGLEHVYEWVEHPIAAKTKWLDPTFFSVRQIVGLAILYGTALALVYWSMRPDVGRLRDRVQGWRRSLYDRLTAGWEGEDVELERSADARAKLAPAYVVIYAVFVTLWVWDWLMSIDPHWFSTLFPAWIFMTYFLGALVVTAILTCRLQAYPPFAHAVPPRYLHDIGKMVFAFTIFWTYLFFAQYLVIWYGNVPVETRFFVQRFFVQPWNTVAWVVLIVGWLIPFVMTAMPGGMALFFAAACALAMLLWLPGAGTSSSGAQLVLMPTSWMASPRVKVSSCRVTVEPRAVAASNWAATARLVAREHPDAVLIDVGTTTADVIPIVGGARLTMELRSSAASRAVRKPAKAVISNGLLRMAMMPPTICLPNRRKAISSGGKRMTLSATTRPTSMRATGPRPNAMAAAR